MGIEVKESNIHGKGVFALQGFNEGDFIGRYDGPETSEDDTYVLWVEVDDNEWRGYDGQGRLRYLNHSSYPNSEFKGRDLFATRAIQPGEEITFYYGDEWEDVA